MNSGAFFDTELTARELTGVKNAPEMSTRAVNSGSGNRALLTALRVNDELRLSTRFSPTSPSYLSECFRQHIGGRGDNKYEHRPILHGGVRGGLMNKIMRSTSQCCTH